MSVLNSASSSTVERQLHLPPLRPYQQRSLTETARDQVIISAPQLGKTVLARLWILTRAVRHYQSFGPDRRPWWWTSPTYSQVKHGIEGVVDYARQWGILHSYTTTTPLEVRLTFGARIQGRSWDNPQGMYGPTVLGGVSDEFGWMSAPGYSAISSRRAETVVQGLGDWLWIGNVGTIGGEAQKIWDLANRGGLGFSATRWTWKDKAESIPCKCGIDICPINDERYDEHAPDCQHGMFLAFIASERQRMSQAAFAQLYDAEWADFNDLPVYSFERSRHVNAEISEYQPGRPVLLSCDFNVDPMVWTLAQTHGDRGWVFDEVVIRGHATSQAAIEEVIQRYPDRQIDWVIFGDRSGKSRDTKTKQTDYSIIRSALDAHSVRPCEMRVPSANPPVTSRVNCVNAMLEHDRLTYHPRCEATISDRAQVSWKPGTREIDKKDKTKTHASDADDYRWAVLFPVEVGGGDVYVEDSWDARDDQFLGMEN